VDNLVTGKLSNIDHIKSDRFIYLKHDITKPIYFGDKIDYIFHLASPASPVDYSELPIQTLKVGALGTYNILGLAKEHGARMLLASTSEVYGDTLINPQPESYWGNVNPIGPRGVYDEAKRYAEAITMAYHRYHGVDTRVVRIFNTYGPRMRANDGRVVPNFISQALKGEPLTVYGDGSQTRSFCYVSDLIEGIYRLMLSDYAEPVNIGNPDEMTILEFAKEVLEIIKSDSNVVFKDLPMDDPKVRRPDISKAKKVLDWEPKIGLETGLKKTIDFFRNLNYIPI
jgi:dTDP-glucose 4,6-dehydratase